MLVHPSSLLLLLLTSGGVILSSGQITGLAAGGGLAVLGAGNVREDFHPLGSLPWKSAPHKSASQLAGGGAGTGWVCLLSIWTLPVKVLLGVRLSCPWAHQSRTQSLLPCLSKFLCLGTCPLDITHPPLALLARIPGHSGYPPSLLSLQSLSC